MSMPQVHIVAYCTDLGYGAARGAEMLSLMLACGIVSRLVSGCHLRPHRRHAHAAAGLGPAGRGAADVPAVRRAGAAVRGVGAVRAVPGRHRAVYAIIVREHFAAAEAGARVGTVIMATLLGMALGGWMSGKVFDLTGSYHAAFINGIGWNLLNFGIVLMLLMRVRRRTALAGAMT
jgi:hypothetical protein